MILIGIFLNFIFLIFSLYLKSIEKFKNDKETDFFNLDVVMGLSLICLVPYLVALIIIYIFYFKNRS